MSEPTEHRRRAAKACVVVALFVPIIVGAASATGAAAPSTSSTIVTPTTTTVPSALPAKAGVTNSVPSIGSTLTAGIQIDNGRSLSSQNGRFRAFVNTNCRLVITDNDVLSWVSNTTANSGCTSSSYFELMPNGSIQVFNSSSPSSLSWTNDVPAGANSTLTLGNTGILRVVTHGQQTLAWNSALGGTSNNDYTLTLGQTLSFGRSMFSANGAWQATIDLNGNFDITPTAGGAPVWQTGTLVTGARTLQVRSSDSSILLLDPSLASTWASGTAGMIGSKLVLGDKGVLRYYGAVGQLWNSTVSHTGLITWHMPRTVGVYAYGSNADTSCPYYSQPLCDGWPIIGITGGLGTSSAPWVDTSGSSDYQTGLAIQNSGRSVPWLSFWTVSSPGCTMNHFTAGATGVVAADAVAKKIDSYGLSIKPTYVILDPEGYPDNHSGLDCRTGPGGSVSQADKDAWKYMLNAWVTELAAKDPSLHGAVYSDQGEYASYGIASLPIPEFLAVAFGYSGKASNPLVPPSPISSAIPYGASKVASSNVKGVIAFYVGVPVNLECSWNSVAAQDLANWGGPLNTLQFDPGTNCAA